MKFLTRLFTVSALIAGTANLSYAQDSTAIAREMYNMGMELYNLETRKQATEIFIQATDFDPSFAKAQFMSGKGTLETVHKEEALPYLLKAYELDHLVDDEILLLIGEAYQYSEEFDKAIEYFEVYRKQLSRSLSFEKAQKIYDLDWKIFECRNGKIYLANPVNVEITNLPGQINSEYPDYAPLITADEKTLIFTSRRPHEKSNGGVAEDFEYYEDIYFTNMQNGQWAEAMPFDKPINGEYHNSNVGLSPDGDVLYTYTDENGGDILESDLIDGKWSKPQPIKGLVNTPYQENSATITNDKQTLFFTSDKPGGYGGMDIYKSKLDKNGRWGKPVNLGPEINTERDEEAPFISKSGLHLFFSSSGHAGMGDLDIYRAELNPETNLFHLPVNLGYPINSVENDIFFVLNGPETHAYYSSVKATSKGDQDIYRIDMTTWQPLNLDSLRNIKRVVIAQKVPGPENETNVTPEATAPQENEGLAPVTTSPKADDEVAKEIALEVTLLDARTLDTLEAKVALVNLADQKVVAAQKLGSRYGIDFTNDNFAQYRLQISKAGYLPYESIIHVLGAEKRKTQIKETIALNPIENTFTGIMNVFFGHDSAMPNTFEDLQYLEYLMKDNPGIKVEISGYTDNTGDAGYNKSLSQRRADAIKDYLVEHGIDAFRIESKGYGEENPIGDNETRIGRRLNRRTEFKIIL